MKKLEHCFHPHPGYLSACIKCIRKHYENHPMEDSDRWLGPLPLNSTVSLSNLRNEIRKDDVTSTNCGQLKSGAELQCERLRN